MVESLSPGRASSPREGYDRWSPIYDHDVEPIAGPGRAAYVVAGRGCIRAGRAGPGVRDWSPLRRGRRLERRGHSGRLFGGDARKGRRKPGVQAIRFVVHDLYEVLPFEAGTFDRVVSGLVVEHLRDLDPVFPPAPPRRPQAGRTRGRLRHAPGDDAPGERGTVHGPSDQRTGRAGKRSAPVQRNHHGGREGGVPPWTRRGACPRR